MKKSTSLVLSAVVLLGLTGVYIGVRVYTNKIEQKETETEENEIENIFSATADELKGISFVSDNSEISFVKEDEVWTKEGEKEFPVDQTVLEEAESTVLSVYSQNTIKDVTDLSQYGLDEPVNTIRLELEEKEQVFYIGDSSVTGDYYVRMNDDESTIYLVDAAVVEPFAKGLYDYAESETFPDVMSSSIHKVEVEKEEGSYVLEKNEETDLWDVGDGKVSEKADSAKAGTLTSAIGALEYAKFVDYDCTDLEKYGLDQPFAEVVVDYTEEVEESTEESMDTEEETESEDELQELEEESQEDADGTDEITETSEQTDAEVDESTEMVEVDRQLVIHVGNETADASRYVTVNDSTAVYAISEESLSSIIDVDQSAYWDMNVCYLSVNQLETLEVSDGETTQLVDVSRETLEDEDGETSETLTYQMDGEEVDSTGFTTFYNKLINLTGVKRLTEEYVPEDEKIFEAKATDVDGAEMQVVFYEYDTNYNAVVVGEKVYLVNKMDVKDMMEAYQKLMES